MPARASLQGCRGAVRRRPALASLAEGGSQGGRIKDRVNSERDPAGLPRQGERITDRVNSERDTAGLPRQGERITDRERSERDTAGLPRERGS